MQHTRPTALYLAIAVSALVLFGGAPSFSQETLRVDKSKVIVWEGESSGDVWQDPMENGHVRLMLMPRSWWWHHPVISSKYWPPSKYKQVFYYHDYEAALAAIRKDLIPSSGKHQTIVLPGTTDATIKTIGVSSGQAQNPLDSAYDTKLIYIDTTRTPNAPEKVITGSTPFIYPEYLFPWPPPRPTCYLRIPREAIRSAVPLTKLKEVVTIIQAAFDRKGYAERSFYRVPGGFAAVTGSEYFGPDGKPLAESQRWIAGAQVGTYVKNLFVGETRRARMFVFLVTEEIQRGQNIPMTPDLAREWLLGGLPVLPEDIGGQAFGDRHRIDVLVYEFEKKESDKELRFLARPSIGATHHLSGLVDGI